MTNRGLNRGCTACAHQNGRGRVADGRQLNAELRARLDAIAKMESTINVADRATSATGTGWHLDDREIALPVEMPGVPAVSGSFAMACRILERYAFPPPRLIRGTFDPDAPLAQRPMLLTATYLWMTFELPVRVSSVIDTDREVQRDGDRGTERVWGYSYETLAGHVERGEITFEVTKHLASGAVHFRIRSFSQTGHIANPFYRVGFRVVGRRLQRRFAAESLLNMRAQVTVAMNRAVAPDPLP